MKIKAFLGVCTILFWFFKLILMLALGKSTFCLRSESTAPYNCQSKYFLTSMMIPYSYRLRINIFTKKHQHSFSNSPCNRDPSTMTCWYLTFKGKPFIFWSRPSGNLGYCLTIFVLWAYRDFHPKGIITGGRNVCWTLCFPLRIFAKWVRTLFCF